MQCFIIYKEMNTSKRFFVFNGQKNLYVIGCKHETEIDDNYRSFSIALYQNQVTSYSH